VRPKRGARGGPFVWYREVVPTVRVAIALALALSAGVVATACAGDDGAPPPAGEDTTTSGPSTTSGGTLDPTVAVDDDGVALTTSGADTTGAPGDDGLMGECDIWQQDCASGDKCVPWSAEDDLLPDDIRCCPEVANPRLAGEDCMVQDYFGSCIDDCAVGTFCMDVDGDGAGQCQPFCSGDPSSPVCEPDESCLFYFAGVPICFPECDPLVQNCTQDGWGCYPDEEANGGTGFICLPTIIGSTYGGFCWLLSSCAPGLICVTPDFHPDCDGNVGCCTPLCDVTETDECATFNPQLECVSWYFAGQEPPSANLQNVGACVIPP
jgi:hypothetical protein